MNIRPRLYLSTISPDAPRLAAETGAGIELAQFCTALNMDPPNRADYLRDAQTARAAASRATFHAPFAELCPAAVDPLARELAARRFDQAFELAQALDAPRMIAHSGFIPKVYFPEWFLEQSAEFWRAFLQGKPEDFSLCIENVLEADPRPLAELIDAIADRRAGICLDVGHAAVQSLQPVERWVDVLGRRIAHVHLHNNDRAFDRHRPLGDGALRMRPLLDRLLERAPDASWTLESVDCAGALGYLAREGFLPHGIAFSLGNR